jgi:hypothetical protein
MLCLLSTSSISLPESASLFASERTTTQLADPYSASAFEQGNLTSVTLLIDIIAEPSGKKRSKGDCSDYTIINSQSANSTPYITYVSISRAVKADHHGIPSISLAANLRI